MHETPFSYDVTLENFQQVVVDGSLQAPVLVDFWADWCTHCHTLKPMLERLAEEYAGRFILAKVDTDSQQQLAAHFSVRSLPTVKLVKGGEIVDEFMGALPESQVRAFIERHLEVVKNPLHAQAAAAYEAGNLEEAEDLLRLANQENPNDLAVIMDLARVFAAKGDVPGAEEILAALPHELRESDEVRAMRAQFKMLSASDGLPDLAALQAKLASDPNDSEANFQLALYQIMGHDYEHAMEGLLGIMRRDRAYGEDAARKRLMELFEMLGADDPLVRTYRRKVFQLMY